MDNKYYWANKNSMADLAVSHTNDMQDRYHKDIDLSVKNSVIYSHDYKFNLDNKNIDCMALSVVPEDSVEAIMNHSYGKTAVLNFASYKNPGGFFIGGSRAQEECLCHESFLYNVLKCFSDYYKWNNDHKNNGLYLNRAIYSPTIRFERNGNVKWCDVISCAAPNYSTYSRFNNDYNKNYDTLKSRIKFILSIAKQQKVDTLILGAYGCGVFGQDAEEVAKIFKEYLTYSFRCFKTVIFAVPNSVHAENYTKMLKILNEY